MSEDEPHLEPLYCWQPNWFHCLWLIPTILKCSPRVQELSSLSVIPGECWNCHSKWLFISRMEYNINSFSFKYNRFANFSNPYINNIVPNSMNQTTNQCFQCSDQPFIRTILHSNANSCHIPSPYNPRKFNLQKQSITGSTPQTSSLGKLSSTFTIDSILETNKNSANNASPSMHSSQSNITYLDIKDEVLETTKETNIYNWLNCSRYKPPKVNSKWQLNL